MHGKIGTKSTTCRVTEEIANKQRWLATPTFISFIFRISDLAPFVQIRPEPKPDEPPVFSTTIGPQKSHSTGGISPAAEGYVNPMKVEGESWMLGRRRAEQSQQGGHGLESAGGELAPPPFVRPARVRGRGKG